MKKLAVQIPTYKHPDTMNTVLERQMPVFSELGIDVYIYDSSPDRLTKYVVDRYIKMFPGKIFYCRVSPTLQVERKIVSILAGNGLEDDYEYFWPCKDRELFGKDDIVWLLNKLSEQRPDLLVMIPRGYNPSLTKKTIVDISPEDLYRDYPNAATSIDASIYRRDSLLADVSVPKRDYTPDDHILNFPHYKIMLESLDKMKSPKITVLRGVDWNEVPTPSGWEKDIFKVWIDQWLDLNDNLPDRYKKYEDESVKRTVNHTATFGGIRRITNLNGADILTEEKFAPYRKKWHRVSNIPLDYMDKIMRHDVLSIYGLRTGNDYVDALINICQRTEDGSLEVKNIQWNAIKDGILDYIRALKYPEVNSYYAEWINDYKSGIVRDLFNEIIDTELSLEDLRELLTRIIVTVI